MFFLFFIRRPPPTPTRSDTLFPFTPLCRSDPADAADVTGERPARRLDVPSGDPRRCRRRQTEGAEVQRSPALRQAVDAALVRLTKLGALRGQHVSVSSRSGRQRCCPPPPGCCSANRLSCAIGSCAMISPLNTQTLTPQVP